MSRPNFMVLAVQNGCHVNEEIVNHDALLPRIEDSTKQNHQRQLDRWRMFIKYKNEQGCVDGSIIYDVVTAAYDVMILKDFIRTQAYSIKGTKNLKACVETVRNYWNTFTGAWKREHDEIGRDTINTVTQFIYGPLAKELELLLEKRRGRHANGNHIVCYAEQIWARDFHVYRRPSTRVNDWGLFLSNVFSTARIGEYIESDARRGSERGLYYKDVMFICLRNDSQQPELAIQLTKDAKNMPTHALAEGDEPHLLCFNALLPFLSHFLTIHAFRDYNTIEELLDIEPPSKVRSCQIHWKESLLNTPFFVRQSKPGEACIETANAFSGRMRNAGIRAGCYEPPTQHDFRREGLFQTDKYYSEATRMRQAAQTSREVYGSNYQPSNSGVHGEALFDKTQRRREDVNDAFREMSIPYNPNLSWRLPARIQHEIETSEKYVALEEAIQNIRSDRKSDSEYNLQNLLREKRELKELALRKWQETQAYQPNSQLEYHRRIFDRVRFMMPQRDRLAENLFQVGTLRSEVGLSVLRDMMALQQQASEVHLRPGLDQCDCIKEEGCKYPGQYDWKHLYICRKQGLAVEHGFAEFCFLCHKWFLGNTAWDKHCLEHLEAPGGYPMHIDPLVYGGVLASPGYCPFCLRNTSLTAPDRMKQFIHRQKWLNHVHRHVNDLQVVENREGCVKLMCPHREPQCPNNFESVLDMEFHLQDIHGIDMTKRSKPRQRSTKSASTFWPSRKRQGSTIKLEDEELKGTIFINATPRQMRRPRKRRRLEADVTILGSTLSTNSSDEKTRASDTSSIASFDYGNIDPALLTSDESAILVSCDQDIAGSDSENVETPNVQDSTESGEPAEARPLSVHFTDPLDMDVGIAIASEIDLTSKGPSSSAVLSNCHTTIQVANAGQASCPDINKLGLALNLGAAPSAPQSDVPDTEMSYEVADIVAKARIGTRVWYRIRWKDFPESENSWVKRKDIGRDAMALWTIKPREKRLEYGFGQLVSQKTVDNVTCFVVKLEGGPPVDDLLIGEGDISGKLLARHSI